MPLLLLTDGTDGQTRQTSVHYIDPAPYTMQAVSITGIPAPTIRPLCISAFGICLTSLVFNSYCPPLSPEVEHLDLWMRG